MDPTKRFSNRVEDYVKYRPGYPAGLVDLFRAELDVSAPADVADVGSGTGKLAELLLDAGYRVAGVEPNDEMREAAERLLAGRAGFRSVAGRAEATTLGDASVDLVVAGQAFHWFDPEATRHEFARILRPGGPVALVWNERDPEADAVAAAYEEFLQTYCPEYAQVTHLHAIEPTIDAFFGAGRMRRVRFENSQTLDRDGLRGRILSCSYVPKSGPDYLRMAAALPSLFERLERNDVVTLRYETNVYFGRLTGVT